MKTTGWSQTHEWLRRVNRLIHERRLSPSAAQAVVNAAMFGIGCIPAEYARLQAAQIGGHSK